MVDLTDPACATLEIHNPLVYGWAFGTFANKAVISIPDQGRYYLL